ncbi:hypothetical protein JCM8115_001421 [Rhodotorula mucilaginosa]|nr:hypothetical protein B0A53_01680 [Rhodotorula sp. CCFEE 5036]
MPGKKRAASSKPTAGAKRQKSSGGGGAPNRNTVKPEKQKSAKSIAKKDRKGKGPAYIPIPEVGGAGQRKKRRNGGAGDDDEDDVHAGDSSADEEDDDASYGEDEELDAGMDVDEDLADVDGADFLTRLDKKGMSASRAALAEAYKKDKAALPVAPRKSQFSHIKVEPAGPTKSELKAIKKRDIARKKKLKALGPDAVLSDDEDDEPPIVTGKAHPDGELVDDLESDDFAFGSGDDDDDLDDLSTMSEWSDNPDIDTGDSMSDLGSEDDDEEGLWSDEDGSDLESLGGDSAEGSEPAFDSEEEVGSAFGESEDDEASAAEDEDGEEEEEEELSRAARKAKKRAAAAELDNLETQYEASRPLHKLKEPKARPTKLPTIVNGQVVRTNEVLDGAPVVDSEDDDDDELLQEEERSQAPEYKSDPLGQRFGRPAVRQLLEIKDKKERIRRAREEIADLGREAAGTGEGEGGLNLLRRLLSLCGPKFHSSSAARSAGEKAIFVDREIRIMAMVSLLAVFIDVVPGYRIRELSEAEREVQVSQLVARQREWENGLVSTYKKFLEICAAEVKENSALAPAAVHCLCSLIREKPDFNFAVNIMDVIVKRLGRKGWDESHQLCLDAVIYLFQHDTTTTAFNSLHLVRLISRLVRARGFAVRPEVISALLNLRLKEELGGGRIRASASAVFREREGKHGAVRWNKEKNHKGRKGGKAKEAMSKKGSKKARQARKEQEAVEKEMREAEGAINQEERERNQTETLKLLFALYFRIVKLDYRSPLLPAALEGLARFAHLVNIDFFRDLLECLKGIVYRGTEQAAEEDGDDDDFVVDSLANAKRNDMREKLLCIVTAFELLQGQGESLNVDLGDFVTALYALILPLSLSPTIEEAPYLARSSMTLAHRQTHKLAQTEADLLFRALTVIFLVSRSLPSSGRTLAYSKRLISASLNWPAATQLRTLTFLRSLLIREPKLEAMLETSDRRVDGRWRGLVDTPELAEPESTCWFEATVYYRQHPDEKVRAEARKLVNWQRE